MEKFGGYSEINPTIMIDNKLRIKFVDKINQ